MKKYIKAIALAVAMTLVCSIPVFAAEEHREGKTDWQVTFTKNKEMVSNFKTAEIDDTIYAMEPGDDVKFTLHLTNEHPSTTDWYMENEVLRSLENSQQVANGGAYTYRLEYTGPSGNKTLYDSEKVGGADQASDTGIVTGAGEEGLHQATSSLEDFFYLDTLKSGESGSIYLYVMLEGESLVNAYQDTLAQLQMNFAVELTSTPNTPNTPGRPPRTPGRRAIRSPKTGDYSRTMMWSVIALVSGLACLVVIVVMKRRSGKNKTTVTKMLVALLAGATALGGFQVRVDAAENQPSYEYTITFSSGKAGTFGGGDRIVRTAKYGDVISFNAVANTTVYDADKYYVRGIKKSGQDNNQRLANASFVVTEDADFVVAYGAIGSMVAYTIQYVDENGSELAQEETYYGNIGDKPVVACLYVDGYRPQAQNLTKTLGADAGSNVFRFVYRRIASAGSNGSGNQTTGGNGAAGTGGGTGNAGAAGTGTTGNGTTGNGTAGNGTAANGNAAGPGSQNSQQGNPPGQNGASDNGTQAGDGVVVQPGNQGTSDNGTQGENEDTQDLVDLDENDVPLADVGLDKEEEEKENLHSSSKAPLIWGGIAAVAALAGLGGLVYLLIRKKKEK